MKKSLLALLLCLALLPALTLGAAATVYEPVVTPSEESTEVRMSGRDAATKALIAVGVGCGVALIVCLIVKSSMRTVRMQSAADRYVTEAGLSLTARHDRFLRRTEQHEPIHREQPNQNRPGRP